MTDFALCGFHREGFPRSLHDSFRLGGRIRDWGPLRQLPFFTFLVSQFGYQGGTHSQQKVLTELCLQDKTLERASRWRL